MSYVYDNSNYVFAADPYQQQQGISQIPLQMNMGDPYQQQMNMDKGFQYQNTVDYVYKDKSFGKLVFFGIVAFLLNFLIGGFSLLLAIKSLREQVPEIKKKCRQCSLILGVTGMIVTLVSTCVIIPIMVKYYDFGDEENLLSF